ncbi:hypothetical protein SUGI_1059330 [Cryptomeria japonica]|uniref:pathogenesis-related thaumatin-like protein 3.5 n=1 Tax=Cryptomeria japonica TaxID=3369 RepID=UPI00241490D9|nr:pathogenesis-related thaumatin-like protein 3.5 [Cryptomeria japonica]GLJ49849.1 hypothetical protein SUGI_1059330 [Cryptomeria japonica]
MAWVLALMLLFGTNGAHATVFTIVNNCAYTVWPGTLSGNGGTVLGDGGFALPPGKSMPFTTSAGWSGRIWGRTDCKFDKTGKGSCITGDCGNSLKCNSGGVAPASLAEFTLGDKDFYDVSLVDGYNLPLTVTPVGGTGGCKTAGCVTDLRTSCPSELSVKNDGQVTACKSACLAFGTPEYCCTGEHSNPQTCSPSKYSKEFKQACPNAYTYAFDDPSSLYTCSAANYTITFCPTSY